MALKGIGFYDNDFFVIKEGRELIIENIKRILTTLPGENVGNVNFGCKLREYIFDFENVLLEDAEQEITSAISKWEPRVEIFSVDVTQDEINRERIYISLNLLLKESYEKFNLTIPISF